MKKEDRFTCPGCGGDTFHIDAKTLERGDKPTEAECSRCGAVVTV